MKTCTQCGETKPMAQFHRDPQTLDGRHPWCAPCKNSRTAGYYRRWTPAQRVRHRARVLRYRHGVEPEVIAALYAEQDGKCALCRRVAIEPLSEKGEGKKPSDILQIDHDHETGAIRGLLCFECNTGIGKLGDSAELLTRAAEYVLKERGQQLSR